MGCLRICLQQRLHSSLDHLGEGIVCPCLLENRGKYLLGRLFRRLRPRHSTPPFRRPHSNITTLPHFSVTVPKTGAREQSGRTQLAPAPERGVPLTARSSAPATLAFAERLGNTKPIQQPRTAYVPSETALPVTTAIELGIVSDLGGMPNV